MVPRSLSITASASPLLETPMSHARNVRLASNATRQGVVAVIMECVDRTCTVVSRGRAAIWPSVGDAMRAVKDLAPTVVWRETRPGFWVARGR